MLQGDAAQDLRLRDAETQQKARRIRPCAESLL
jgi:hypothetical protein